MKGSAFPLRVLALAYNLWLDALGGLGEDELVKCCERKSEERGALELGPVHPSIRSPIRTT